MKREEYEHVKDMTYLEYCRYLHEKYGIGRSDYMTPAFNKVQKCSRTAEGLYAHHLYENMVPSLSDKEMASKFPFELQKAENIVYCNLLEHLLLHVKIFQDSEYELKYIVGFGGCIDYFIPELNDVYSGWVSSQHWRKICHSKILGSEQYQVYLDIVKQLMTEWYKTEFGDGSSSNNRRYSVRYDTSFITTSMNLARRGRKSQLHKVYNDLINIAVEATKQHQVK